MWSGRKGGGRGGALHLQAVAVHEHLGHGAAAHVHVLDLLGGDVLALRQLEDVLLPVDDLQDTTLTDTHTHTHSPGPLGSQGTSLAPSS